MLSIKMSSSPSGSSHKKQIHVALFPWLAFGHIIPFLEVAKHIASNGHKVSFISTPRNIQCLPKIPQTLIPLITLVQIPLPRVENLPKNAEATIDVPYDVIPHLKIAHDGLEKGITEFLQAQSPDWIIHDFAPHWLPPIASNLNIPNAHFSIFNASSICFALGSTSPNRVSNYAPRTKPEHFTSSPEWFTFPSDTYFKPFEAKKLLDGTMTPNASGVTDIFRFQSTIQGCQVYFIRSCRELEGKYLELLEDLHEKPVVLPTGLLPPSLPTSNQDDGKDSNWSKILEWLEKQEKGKVVYVAFGSELNLSQEEFNELAIGLELCGLPFFWVLRKPSYQNDGSVNLPDGFVDRVKGRGLIWTSWAPQLRILSHDSVGGFLTHCGWSSIIESLQYGRPLIMLPFMYDQGLIARFWDTKIGSEVARDEESGWFTREELANSLKMVVVEKEGKKYRDGASEYGKLFRDKELHDSYMDECVEYLVTHARA